VGEHAAKYHTARAAPLGNVIVRPRVRDVDATKSGLPKGEARYVNSVGAGLFDI
jgi:hypothetical protein